MGLTMKVLEVSGEGVATVETVFDSLKVSTKTGELEVEFDSSKPPTEDDLVAAMLKPLVGSSITMTVDRSGNITGVTGGEAMAMLGQMAGGGGGGGGGGAASRLFGPIFSGKPTAGFAKVGQSWEHEDRVSSGLLGDFRMVTRHTLRGMRGRDAQLGISGRIEPASEAPGESSFQVKNSEYTGSYVWDTARGQLSKMDTTMDVRLEGKAGEQEIATRSRSAVKIVRLR